MANPYRELLSTPGVPGLVIASAIARLPLAMVGIGLITMLVQHNGEYWLAGAIAATFTLANALIGPHLSRLVDRRGQSRVLPWVTSFSIIMLLALIAAVYNGAPAVVLFILAVLAGSMPSMPAMIRARWTHLFRGSPQLHTAFSLDTVLTEMSFIIGPPLAIGLSTGLFAEAGPLAAVLLLAIGVTAFLLQRRTEPQVIVASKGKARSTLHNPGLRIIVLALLAMGVIGGAVDVAVVAFANEHDWPTSASFILAAYAMGSMIAGLSFGAFQIGMPIEKQFFIALLITALTAVLPVFSPNVYALAAMLLVAGISFAPTMVIAMNLGSIIVPAARMTEGLTWMSTGISIGVALGSMLAGLVIDVYGSAAGFGVGIGAGLFMVATVLFGLPALREATSTHEEYVATAQRSDMT